MNAIVLVESSAFVNAKKAITSLDSKVTGKAAVKDVNLGGSTNDAPSGTLSVPYTYSVVGSANAKSASSSSGATLSF